ncbi:uncharacterized protein LOC144181498 [Stigmatopora nigra]
MSERRRILPTWMSKKDKAKGKPTLKTTKKQKKTARSVFYCMNEKELLEAAAAYLGTEADQQVQSKMESTVGKRTTSPNQTGNPVTLEKPCENINISKTDLNVAEMATVAYDEDAEGEEKAEDQGGDDAMRLVREIFFT